MYCCAILPCLSVLSVFSVSLCLLAASAYNFSHLFSLSCCLYCYNSYMCVYYTDTLAHTQSHRYAEFREQCSRAYMVLGLLRCALNGMRNAFLCVCRFLAFWPSFSFVSLSLLSILFPAFILFLHRRYLISCRFAVADL